MYRQSNSSVTTLSTTTTNHSSSVSAKVFQSNILLGNENGAYAQTTNTPIQQCSKPSQHVAFLKVHKASSTTVMNIFLRYGDSHNLNIVLPKTKDQGLWNYLGAGTTVQKSRINKIPANESYNILCNHVVYNRDAFHELLGPTSINIGIVRDPFTHFPSAASYYGLVNAMSKRFGENVAPRDLLSYFLKSPSTYGKAPHVHNGMFFDFGLPVNQFENETAINNYLLKIDEEFPLILVTELFDESLVLMKRMLCWDLKDILYVPLNINKKKQRDPIVLSEQAKMDLFAYNYADFKLYIFAKERLLKQIANEVDLKSEVIHFRRINKFVSDFCRKCAAQNFKTKEDFLTIDGSAWNKKFIIYSNDCEFMMSQELSLLLKLMTKAELKYNNWVKSLINPRHVVA